MSESLQVPRGVRSNVDLQQQGKQLGFANAYLHANGKRIVRGSAVFTRASEGG